MKNLVLVLAFFACTAFCYAQEGSIRMINSAALIPVSHVIFTKVVTHTAITVESEHGIVSQIELPSRAQKKPHSLSRIRLNIIRELRPTLSSLVNLSAVYG